jgi:cellulose synthase/poly-beta-1,6-N-acetylglucosamine synthase-like glycosyltransferase
MALRGGTEPARTEFGPAGKKWRRNAPAADSSFPEEGANAFPVAGLAGYRNFQSPFSTNDNVADRLEEAAELECLSQVLSPPVLDAAWRRAVAAGVGADRVLVENGTISEDVYLRHLSRQTGIARISARDIQSADCRLRSEQYITAAGTGVLPVKLGGRLVWIVAPRGLAARRLARLTTRTPEIAGNLRLATAAIFHMILIHFAGSVLTRQASHGLGDLRQDWSAAPHQRKRPGAAVLVPTTAGMSLSVLFPQIVFEIITGVLALWFLAFVALRLTASFALRASAPLLPPLSDEQLPVYTIIAALYREASSVSGLINAIRELDYPREKLDIKLVVEADDLETRAAIARLQPISNVEIIIAFEEGPRTKPKALNCALPFARGSFTVIYDAEDRPEPGQLRAALDAFRHNGRDVACAQARLCIDNPSDSWLSRMFTSEYAGQFDVFLPGFVAFGLPIPLGGSSNHFRTAVLRQVAGWDAFNVTEDADLGVRLARFGYRSVVFQSTTYEEAPSRFGAWLRQRTRWMKGWMQTWAVHMRSPRRLWQDLGPRGFFALNIAIGGNVLTALVHPFFVAELVLAVVNHMTGRDVWLFKSALAPLHDATIVSGYLAAILIGAMGLLRRGLPGSLWVLVLMPLYWFALSLAAWRALFQFLHKPYHWEKTEHGLARSSQFVGGRRRQRR